MRRPAPNISTKFQVSVQDSSVVAKKKFPMLAQVRLAKRIIVAKTIVVVKNKAHCFGQGEAAGRQR